MLLNAFYTIREQIVEGDRITTRLVFNKNHPVYEGHFRNNPITPGVCLLQTTKQILETYFRITLCTAKILQVKFLKLVIPDESKLLTFSLALSADSTDQKKKVQLLITDQDNQLYTKANIIYQSV